MLILKDRLACLATAERRTCTFAIWALGAQVLPATWPSCSGARCAWRLQLVVVCPGPQASKAVGKEGE
jgi:hypothetical protein